MPTPNYGFEQPTAGTYNWDDEINGNFSTLDSHADKHVGADAIRNATNSQSGLATATQITNLEANTTKRHDQNTDTALGVQSQDIDMGLHKVSNMAPPTLDTDAATKQYVDTAVIGLDWQDSVLSKSVTDPSTLTPNPNDRYIVGTGAIGVWSGHDDEVAVYNGSGWDFYVPNKGWATLVEDENKYYTYTTSWVSLGSIISHGNLQGLSNDDHTQYHNDTRGDSRYYRQNQFINSSIGVPDAGKPIVLDGSGLIDSSMISFGTIDHGSLTGLSDDDHSQYLLVNGTRSMTGILDMGTHKISNVVDPTLDQDASSKKYVDDRTVKDIFFNFDFSNNFGDFRTKSIGATGGHRITFRIPSDFGSLVSLKLIGIPNANITSQNVDIASDYGALGETYNNHSESNSSNVISATINTISEWDVSSVFSSLAAGDYCGLFIDHKGIGTGIDYLGLRLVYTV